MIFRSPANRLRLPKNTKSIQKTDPHVYLTPEQLEKIFDRFPERHPSHLPMMIALHCGLRLGEVYGLIWDDIDFENKKLSVNRQIQWWANKDRFFEDKQAKNGSKGSGGYWYFSTAKYESYRTIDLDDVTLALLQREHARQLKADGYYEEYYTAAPLVLAIDGHAHDAEILPVTTPPSDHEVRFVMRRENGTYITPRTMQHTASVIHHKLDIPDFDFHSLRHTHATILNSNHANMVYIRERLGHVKIETTQYIYANHVTEKLHKEGLDLLNSVFINK